MSTTDSREWLESDSLGGFASGPVNGPRTRRYHALLLTSTNGPAERRVLVNGFDLFADTPSGSVALSTQAYAPEVLSPDATDRLKSFTNEPWPKWTFALPGGIVITQEIFVPHGLSASVVVWQLTEPRPGVTLRARPYLSGRDYHAMHRENGAFRFEPAVEGPHVTWAPYVGVPAVHSLANGAYRHDPFWYRNFTYAAEQARGLDHIEDLASPGEFSWDLSAGPAVWILAAPSAMPALQEHAGDVADLVERIAIGERARRDVFPSPLHRAADAYLVQRGGGRTLVAGYPWFTDWGRDTFIAMRGLCLALDRLGEARDILLSWTGAISLGMVPNRFPDHGEQPEYNSVDASLWFVVAVHEFLEAADQSGTSLLAVERERLVSAVAAILEGYAGGTRHAIRADADGLLAAGEPGVQLTWMDAKIGDWVVTPRIGKPVEVQALWLNALWIGTQLGLDKWQPVLDRGLKSFGRRFWNEKDSCLYDVIDVDHMPDRVDATIRPNQVFAIGGLPLRVLTGARAEKVLACIERHLLTPLGLRSVTPEDSSYRPRYLGGVLERDAAYHQGTVWPWLIGPFVEAWVNVHGSSTETRTEARRRFLSPLLLHLEDAGVGHISEVADGDAPHNPGGCPWQAWSLGELIRLTTRVLAVQAKPARRKASPRRNLNTLVLQEAV